jgi:PKD repeat protein
VSIAKYWWDFGDGSLGTDIVNPAHTYLNKSSYTAVLTVTDSDGWSDTASVVITANGPPIEPAGLSAIAVSSAQVNLTWTDRSDDENGFKIERSANGGPWGQIAAVGANVQAYSDGGLSPSTPYSYRVRAYNAAGDSAYTLVANATTQPLAAMHVGDLDGSRSVTKKAWSVKVTVTVHDATHRIVSGAVATGVWPGGGSASCTTGSRGTCTVSLGGISLATPDVTFQVKSVSKNGAAYDPVANHDPDGGSNGTTITISK